MKTEVLFAKQPIFDVNNALYGYEILYRNSDKNAAEIVDGDKATLELLSNYCCGIVSGVNQPYVKIFINLTRNLIMSDIFIPLQPDRIVIEILEDIEVDPELLIRISALKQQGFVFAIDDYHLGMPHLEPLFCFVDYVKLDLLAIDSRELKPHIDNIKALIGNDRSPILLAEKVESLDIIKQCSELGFMLFQGYYLSKPKMVYGKKVSSNSQSALLLLSALQKDDVTIDEVTNKVSQDARLTYQLLKIVNSPLCRLPHKVESIKSAIVYLGLKTVKQWAMIISLTQHRECPLEYLRILLERAKLSELLSEDFDNVSKDAAFVVGLFSGIDIVLQADKHWLLEQIGLSKEINDAILSHSGPMGNILDMAEKLEHGNLDLKEVYQQVKLNEHQVLASSWVAEILKTTK